MDWNIAVSILLLSPVLVLFGFIVGHWRMLRHFWDLVPVKCENDEAFGDLPAPMVRDLETGSLRPMNRTELHDYLITTGTSR